MACRLEAGGLAARASAIRALCAEQAPFKTTPVMRRLRGQDQSETLGAPAQPMVWIEGTGEVMLASRRQHVYVLMVATSPVYIRQTALLGFEGGIHYECGRLAGAPDADGAAVIQLSGTGALVLESDASVSELSVDLEHAPLIRADAVVGWSGRLFSRAIPPEHIGGAHGFVGFEGAGTIYANL